MNPSETNGLENGLTALTEDRLWTTRQAADYLQVSTRSVFNLRKVGLPFVQLGGTIRFHPQKVKDYLAAHPTLPLHRLRQIILRRKAKSS